MKNKKNNTKIKKKIIGGFRTHVIQKLYDKGFFQGGDNRALYNRLFGKKKKNNPNTTQLDVAFAAANATTANASEPKAPTARETASVANAAVNATTEQPVAANATTANASVNAPTTTTATTANASVKAQTPATENASVNAPTATPTVNVPTLQPVANKRLLTQDNASNQTESQLYLLSDMKHLYIPDTIMKQFGTSGIPMTVYTPNILRLMFLFMFPYKNINLSIFIKNYLAAQLVLRSRVININKATQKSLQSQPEQPGQLAQLEQPSIEIGPHNTQETFENALEKISTDAETTLSNLNLQSNDDFRYAYYLAELLGFRLSSLIPKISTDILKEIVRLSQNNETPSLQALENSSNEIVSSRANKISQTNEYEIKLFGSFSEKLEKIGKQKTLSTKEINNLEGYITKYQGSLSDYDIYELLSGIVRQRIPISPRFHYLLFNLTRQLPLDDNSRQILNKLDKNPGLYTQNNLNLTEEFITSLKKIIQGAPQPGSITEINNNNGLQPNLPALPSSSSSAEQLALEGSSALPASLRETINQPTSIPQSNHKKEITGHPPQLELGPPLLGSSSSNTNFPTNHLLRQINQLPNISPSEPVITAVPVAQVRRGQKKPNHNNSNSNSGVENNRSNGNNSNHNNSADNNSANNNSALGSNNNQSSKPLPTRKKKHKRRQSNTLNNPNPTTNKKNLRLRRVMNDVKNTNANVNANNNKIPRPTTSVGPVPQTSVETVPQGVKNLSNLPISEKEKERQRQAKQAKNNAEKIEKIQWNVNPLIINNNTIKSLKRKPNLNALKTEQLEKLLKTKLGSMGSIGPYIAELVKHRKQQEAQEAERVQRVEKGLQAHQSQLIAQKRDREAKEAGLRTNENDYWENNDSFSIGQRPNDGRSFSYGPDGNFGNEHNPRDLGLWHYRNENNMEWNNLGQLGPRSMNETLSSAGVNQRNYQKAINHPVPAPSQSQEESKKAPPALISRVKQPVSNSPELSHIQEVNNEVNNTLRLAQIKEKNFTAEDLEKLDKLMLDRLIDSDLQDLNKNQLKTLSLFLKKHYPSHPKIKTIGGLLFNIISTNLQTQKKPLNRINTENVIAADARQHNNPAVQVRPFNNYYHYNNWRSRPPNPNPLNKRRFYNNENNKNNFYRRFGMIPPQTANAPNAPSTPQPLALTNKQQKNNLNVSNTGLEKLRDPKITDTQLTSYFKGKNIDKLSLKNLENIYNILRKKKSIHSNMFAGLITQKKRQRQK